MDIKNGKLYIYDVNLKYRNYLRRYDSKVSMKEGRRFYGILITKENIDYCIPFTSKVKKRNSKLTINIKNKNKIIAQLLINNMIPVNSSVIEKVDVNKDKYKEYLQDEIIYLKTKNVINEIINKVEKAFMILDDENHRDYKFYKNICCEYKLLEEKGRNYKK